MRKIVLAAGLSALLIFLVIFALIGLFIYGIVKLIVLFPIIILIIALLVLFNFVKGKMILRTYKKEQEKHQKMSEKGTIDVNYKVK